MRIVFSDLDGTLLASDKSLAPRTVAVLDELARRGIEFVPCSGRPPVGLPPELVRHPAVHYAVCANGALVCKVRREEGNPNPTTEVMRRIEMDRAVVARLYEPFRDRDVLFDVFGNGKIYVERRRFERIGTFDIDPFFLPQLKQMRTPVDMTIPELLPTLEHVERITMFWKHASDRDLMFSLVDADPTLVRVNSLPTNIEVSDATATKGSALVWLCAQLGIPVSESVAFGDGSNDAPMLKAAGDGVAMANAMPEALAAADHVAQDNDAPGEALYLEGLLGE